MSLTERASAAGTRSNGKGGPAAGRNDLRMFIVAGEHSGDALGGKLMPALSAQCKGRIHFLGVGGEDMEHAGLVSQFPLEDVAVMGFASILARLPRICRASTARSMRRWRPNPTPSSSSTRRSSRIRSPSASASARRTSPSSTTSRRACGRGGRGGRARCGRTSITCWRCCRSSRPRTSASAARRPRYVGHPLIERLDWLQALDPMPLAERLQLDPGRLRSWCCPAAAPPRSAA